MKIFYITFILLIFISISSSHNIQSKKGQENKQKTFLVKTQLTKEQLETLLQNGENQNFNTSEGITNYNKTTVVTDGDNITTDQGLQWEIEDEIMDDALLPLFEFHVKESKTSETKSFIAKNNAKFIDSLYEKRFGRIYGYLTLLFFAFVLIYFNALYGNKKADNIKNKFVNYYEFDSSKEYMISKEY